MQLRSALYSVERQIKQLTEFERTSQTNKVSGHRITWLNIVILRLNIRRCNINAQFDNGFDDVLPAFQQMQADSPAEYS